MEEEQKKPETAPEATPAPEEKATEAQPAQVDAPEEKAPEAQPEGGQPATDAKPQSKQIELPEVPKDNVTVTVTPEGGETSWVKCRFHTPTLLSLVEKAPDKAKVKIVIQEIQFKQDEGKDPEAVLETRTLLDDTKEAGIKLLKTAVIPPDHLARELKKFAQFLIDHSSMTGISVAFVCQDENGKDAVSGFTLTAENCTHVQAAALVNCAEANVNEFVTKAKIQIPGKTAPKMGGLILPTEEDKEKLGLK